MPATFTVVVCHFGDPFWVTQMVQRVVKFSPVGRVPEIVIVDQDRPAKHGEVLRSLPRVKRVVSYPKVAAEFEALGHDHPSSLNRACAEPFTTSHVMVMDSDTIVTSERWLKEVDAALGRAASVLAGDRKWGLTHPCFMVLPVDALPRIDFAAGSVSLGIDTGRLVGYQLDQGGMSVEIVKPKRAFGGRRGDEYLHGALVHVGSASFAASADARALGQVEAVVDAVVRRRVADGSLRMTGGDVARIRLSRVGRRLGRFVRSIRSRART